MMNLPIDPAFALGLRAALAFVLIMAAAHKMEDVARFRDVLLGYGLLPVKLLPVAPVGLAFVELMIGIGLLIFPLSFIVAVCAGLLFLAYGGVMAFTIGRGRRNLDCGCGAVNQPIDWGLVARNGVLTLIAVFAATPAILFGLSWISYGAALFVAGFAILIYLIADTLLANHARLFGRRVGA